MKALPAIVIAAATALSGGSVIAAERVTVDNFTRVETDHYFKERADAGCFGKFCHEPGPRAVDRQAVIRLNRDRTLDTRQLARIDPLLPREVRMGHPNHYSLEIVGRCRALLEGMLPVVERDGEMAERFGGPLTTTFLLAMATPMVVFPVERLKIPYDAERPRRVANDRALDAKLTAEVDRVFALPFGASPFGAVEGWSCVLDWDRLFNLSGRWPEELLDLLDKPEAADAVAKAPASDVIETLRNGLAHGGVYYLDRHGRNSNGEAAMLAFVGASNFGVIKRFDVVRVRQQDFYNFLLAWSDWLDASGVTRALRDAPVLAA